MPLIYCVEDDESIRELVSYALRGQGYKAGGFGEAAELYEALQKMCRISFFWISCFPGKTDSPF